MRKTKIIVTLGPSTEDEEVLMGLIKSNIDMVRINLSHGTHQQHQNQVEQLKRLSNQFNKHIAILADLQGAKARITAFKNQSINLTVGQEFNLDLDLDKKLGNELSVNVTHPEIFNKIKNQDHLLLNDGLIELKVNGVSERKIKCEVLIGGVLSSYKGINRYGGGLIDQTFSDKDLQDLQLMTELDVDYIGLSFIKSVQDINFIKDKLSNLKNKPNLIAKIERSESISNLDEIIEASDGIMIARGDLGVEIGFSEVPGVQKFIINRAKEFNKPVITATQMMESMITQSVPTRAEVSDVANAVLDGTDAVMLTAETASGMHPTLVVEAVAKVCETAEMNPINFQKTTIVDKPFERIEEAIANAGMFAANNLNIKAILSLTESGATTLYMSRINSNIPIFALSRHAKSCRLMSLFKNVTPVLFDYSNLNINEINQKAIELLKDNKIVTKDDLVLMTRGEHMGEIGGTNTLKILTVK